MLPLSNEDLNSTSNFLFGDFNFPDMNFISVTDNDLKKVMQGERTKTVLVQFENSRDVFVGRTQRKQRNRENTGKELNNFQDFFFNLRAFKYE